MIADAVRQFCQNRTSEVELPVTRFDLQFDLTSEVTPHLWAYLDTEPRGLPCSGRSKTYRIWDRVMEHWAAPCHAANDGEPVVVVAPAGTTTVNDEESLYQAVGPYFVEIVQSLRSVGVFHPLPRAAECYLGVSAYDGTFGWPAWNDRGPENMI
jgi:hypothetical protein